MEPQTPRDWLASVEGAAPEEQWAILCFLAGRSVDISEEERNSAVRRAELLLAAGGDPHRALEPYGRAVTAVANDLDSPERRAGLRAALEQLHDDVQELASAAETLHLLLGDDDLAWQGFAFALLAEELAEESP